MPWRTSRFWSAPTCRRFAIRRLVGAIALLTLSSLTTLAADNWPEPAGRFQQVHSQIITGAPPTAWRAELETLARLPGTDPITTSVRDAACVWLARVQIPELDAVLRRYYRFNARYPTTLDPIEPASLRTDPWGDPWDYRLASPKGLEHLTAQRYKVAPKRYPDLTSLAVAIKQHRPPSPPWKITLRNIGEAKTLEIQSGSSAAALIQPGSTLDGYTLLFIGDHYSLWAGLDQLFAVKF